MDRNKKNIEKSTVNQASASSALAVLGQEYIFPHPIEGMPAKLSDFEGLDIGSFLTSDGVQLSYWAAGTGEPLILLPGWSINGAHFLNVMYLLCDKYRVYTLDFRNQGLSEKVKYGNRISRYAADLKEFTEVLDINCADYAAHSMGASVLWSYIDLYGTEGIKKAAFVDEPPVIINPPDMTEQERQELAVPFKSSEELRNLMQSIDFSELTSSDSPYFENTTALANQVINNDMEYLISVMHDHGTNDWRDVIQNKIDISTAIFSGEVSVYLQSQRWMHSVVADAALYIYSKEEYGDHSLMEKNPVKFTDDLKAFLAR